MSYKYGQKDTLTFGQIILGHYQKILEIARHELRPSERILLLDNNKQFIEQEDTRLSYILAIENLAYALEPYFDKDMTEYFKENIVFLSGFGFEILEKMNQKCNEKLLEKINDCKTDQGKDLLIGFQILKAKDMFRHIGMLMKRVDYLKASVFGDASSEDVIEDDDEEDEE